MEIATDRIEVVTPKPQRLSLRRNFAWTVSGNVIYAACQWGMLVALAKLGSPEMVGQFALGLAVGAPVMMLANLQLRAVQATDARNEYRFGDYLSLRLLTTALAFGVICLIAWVAGYRWEMALVMVLVGIAKSVESVSDVIYGLMQKYERLDRIAVALMLRGIGSVMLLASVLWLTRSVAWAVTALAGWWSTVLLTYEWRTGSALLRGFGAADDRFAPSWVWKRLRRLVWLSFPLGVVMVLISLNINIPRYFVERYLGEAALGYFAALAYVIVAGYTVMNALAQSATPRLARYHVSNRAGFARLLTKMVLLGMVVGGAGISIAALWGRPLLTFLYRRDYAEHAHIFVWLMVAAAISYVGSMLGTGLTTARIFRLQVVLYAASGLGIGITCLFFIKPHGMIAAAWALMVGGTIAVVGSALILVRELRSAGGPLAGGAS